LVSAIGTFATPSLPEIEGLTSFTGPSFHSARWEHEHDLAERRVAVIGTGASAAQIVPELAKVCAQVDVYQRTPQWILPRKDVVFSDEEKERFARDPEAMARHREEIYWGFETNIAFRVDDDGAAGLEAVARSHIDYRITDEVLKAKLMPDYPFGCKRTLVCSDFYKALLRDNVELVTDAIDHITPGGVVCVDGSERTADAIVLATGFKATEYLAGIDVVGVGGRRLHDDWSEMAHAYLGLTVSGYPNFFMLYGPNTNQGGNSIILILEAQAGYVVGALAAMESERIEALQVRREVMDRYNRDLVEALGGTLWHNGCQSYFKDAKGHIVTQLPQTSRWYAERTREFKLEEYEHA
jgi:cation diffusion facilitator CzcD-associated flavoprotein CzcO